MADELLMASAHVPPRALLSTGYPFQVLTLEPSLRHLLGKEAIPPHIDLKTGKRIWMSTAFCKYCSLVAQGDQILALDQRGDLLLHRANPREFERLDQKKVSDEDTWAHLPVSGNELYMRQLNALAAYCCAVGGERGKPA